jgi:hypothetical protein
LVVGSNSKQDPQHPHHPLSPSYTSNPTPHEPQDGWLDAGVTGMGETAVVDPHPPKYVLFAHHLDVLDSVQALVQKELKKCVSDGQTGTWALPLVFSSVG